MPMYPYKNKETGEEIEVLRKFSDYDVPPTKEESGMSEEEYKKVEWVRIIGRGIKLTRGSNWSGSKGNW